MGRGVNGRGDAPLAPRAEAGCDCGLDGLLELSRVSSVTTANEESDARPRADRFAVGGTASLALGTLIVACTGWGCTSSSEDSLVCADAGAELETKVSSPDDPNCTPGMPNSAVPPVVAELESLSTISGSEAPYSLGRLYG